MRKVLSCLLIACSVNLAQAGVTIDGTRIVFPASSSNVGVQIRNEFSMPALVQAWIDDGDLNEIPAAEKIPFVISPPLSRVEPNQGQMIRIIQTGTPQLAQDRETLFWFNMLDIPPEDSNLIAKNILSFTVRTRIKLFYRPVALNTVNNDIYNQIQFSFSETDKNLIINNPTPYFITFVDIRVSADPTIKKISQALMLAPYSTEKINELQLNSSPQSIEYSVLNDLGGVQNFKKKVQ